MQKGIPFRECLFCFNYYPINTIYQDEYLIFVSLSKQTNRPVCFILNNTNMEMINFDGLLIGIVTFLIIGLFHPIVVKAEYYWGTKCWWIFLLLGIAGTVASLLIESVFVSAICGVFAFSSFWTIKEVFEQEERVLKGWFPKNPKRQYPEK